MLCDIIDMHLFEPRKNYEIHHKKVLTPARREKAKNNPPARRVILLEEGNSLGLDAIKPLSPRYRDCEPVHDSREVHQAPPADP